MSLFFKKKRSHSDDNTVNLNSVSITCPHCHFEQTEPRMAVSTYCRGCSTHYKIAAGKAVTNKVESTDPFNSLKERQSKLIIRTTETTEESAPPSENPFFEKTQNPAPTPRKRTIPPSSALVRKVAKSTGFFQNKVSPRNVQCFECEREHQAPSEASSTLCPACGAYISLKDFDIKDNWNSRIRTRGNVIIQKKATVTGITIRCNDLFVHGKLTGGVDCSGDFVLRSHGKIMGKVHCKRLIIEKKAQVEFSNPVHCEDAVIDGNVTGNFTCTGKLHLKKKATLNGDIKVATMVVEEGARHNGRISIGSGE